MKGESLNRSVLASDLLRKQVGRSMKPSVPLPYHKRAARLRWSSLAIDLEEGEVVVLQQITEDQERPERLRLKAKLLLGLHQREAIHDLCGRLGMDRRTLFRVGSETVQELQGGKLDLTLDAFG